MNHNRQKGILLLIGTAILWSLGGVLIKGVQWSGVTVAGMRSIIAAIVILIFMGKPSFKFTWARLGAVISYAATVLLFVMATKMTTAANAILLQYTAPIYTALLGIGLLKERVYKKDVVCIGIIFAGMILFFIDSLKVGNILGDVLALLSGVSFGVMSVFMRMERDNDPVQSIFWGNIVTCIVTLPFMGQLTFTTESVIGILLLGVFQLGLSYILYSKAIKHVSALEAVLIPIIEPLLNPIWVMLLQKEVPSLYAVIGGVIVIGGVTARALNPKKLTIAVEESM
ncbi:DMT family transporter [Cellulosilyticum sp. I15G10I2]|uniref:DMT family transporter n=1 Tax=Cellulosilyticum sp. I15G10I2 TaxID=1892843 RepID=UPI00085C89CC|nr:DMT family transporter [Cellulosilyticum sp. I15G10I2]